MAVVGFKDERSVKNLCLSVILLLGVFLSGSRTVFVLLVVLLIILAVCTKQMRLPVLGIAGLMLGSVLVYVLVSGDNTGIGRLTKLFTQSTELMGRILYFKDAGALLLKNPFGLGSLGYFYLQPQIQTGVYATRYVHNMLLQIGLDAGIPAILVFMTVMIRTFISKKCRLEEKTLLALICGHCLVDFDLEYMCIWLVLLMLLDLGEAKPQTLTKCLHHVISGVLVLASALYVYFGIGFYLGHIGNYEKAMVRYKQESIKRAKYDEKRYEEYLKILEEAMNEYNKRGDVEKVRYYSIMAQKIPQMLQVVKNETDPIAYQIKDKPNLFLSENAVIYLEQLRAPLNE